MKHEKGHKCFEVCDSCGERDRDLFQLWRTNDILGECAVFCRRCCKPAAGIADVYYGYGSGEHTEENIADPVTGQPIPFRDRASKRDAMRRAGIREAGDKIHGARNEDMTPQKRKKYFT